MAIYKKISGTWERLVHWKKISGTWKRLKILKKISGTWYVISGKPFIQLPSGGYDSGDYVDFGTRFAPSEDGYYEIKIKTPSTIDKKYCLFFMMTNTMLTNGGAVGLHILADNKLEFKIIQGGGSTVTFTSSNTVEADTKYTIKIDLTNATSTVTVNGTSWGTFSRLTFTPNTVAYYPEFKVGSNQYSNGNTFEGKIYYMNFKGQNTSGVTEEGIYEMYFDIGTTTVKDSYIADDAQNGTIVGGNVVEEE